VSLVVDGFCVDQKALTTKDTKVHEGNRFTSNSLALPHTTGPMLRSK
jgi:hypothetical protein